MAILILVSTGKTTSLYWDPPPLCSYDINTGALSVCVALFGNRGTQCHRWPHEFAASILLHYINVIMTTMASQITSLTGCLLNLLFGPRSKKTSKLRVTGLCVGNSPGSVNSPHKGPVTRKMFPFDDVIMVYTGRFCPYHSGLLTGIKAIILLSQCPMLYYCPNAGEAIPYILLTIAQSTCRHILWNILYKPE